MSHTLSILMWISLITLSIQFTSCEKSVSDLGENEITFELPEERSFAMGFTAFPYDFTLEAQLESSKNALDNGDAFLMHFDHGVPWEEALNNEPFPVEIQNTISESLKDLTPDHKVILTATPTSQERDKLALYWNNQGSHQELPPKWKDLSFDHPDVISAYINYCQRIIEEVQPDYFGYGIEVNAGFLRNTQVFSEFLKLADTVYHTLKISYPTLPIFMSFQDQSFNKTKDELLEITEIMLEYSDIIAVSTYPFWQYQFPTRDANPDLFSDQWLQDLSDLDPEKPFAISETGFCAEDLIMEEIGVHIHGTEKFQAGYVHKLCKALNKLDAEFICWFVFRDYDQLYDKLIDPPIIYQIWRDNGLESGDGKKRESMEVWNQWKNLPLAN